MKRTVYIVLAVVLIGYAGVCGSIRIPTTIIEAENDEEIPHASTEKLLSRFELGIATMTLIEGVGHNDLGKNKKYRETLQAALK